MGRVDGSLARLDAVTFDVYGTLVELVDPVPRLVEQLAVRGCARDEATVRAALETEARYYRDHSIEGRDSATVAQLQQNCARVFLDELAADIDAAAFADDFAKAMVFEPLHDVRPSLERLRRAGVELGVVSNWDVTVEQRLEAVGLRSYFRTIATSARAGARKPDPAPFELALRELGVDRARTLHIGDSEDDAAGAAAAGIAFAPIPVGAAVAAWT